MVAVFLGGFGNGSDTTFTNFERRDREMQIRIADQRRHDILYGSDEEKRQASEAGVSLSTLMANSTSLPKDTA